jgi:hypothetical protein
MAIFELIVDRTISSVVILSRAFCGEGPMQLC